MYKLCCACMKYSADKMGNVTLRTCTYKYTMQIVGLSWNEVAYFTYVTGFWKTLRMGFFVKIEFDVSLISSTLELTHLQV